MLLCYRTACRLRRFLCRIKTEKRFLFLIFLEKRSCFTSIQKTTRRDVRGQACAFASLFNAFREKNAVVIGISKDSAASHGKFAEKFGLPFVLLSDPDLQAIRAYGVWQEKKLYGKVSMGVVRTTFLIDEAGKIIKVMPKVKPDTNAAEVLAML